jgi:hypothetical protein
MRRFVIFALLTTPLLAQNAEISGRISDPSGLPIPSATVNVQNRETGANRRAFSNQQGLYSVPALLPGSYDLTVEAAGFKSLHQNGVALEVDQRATLDFSLSIGTTAETVTVEGSAPLLNSSDASVSTVIGNRFVENMPLNGRSFSSLINLTPGIVLVPNNLHEQGQFSVNGQRPDANYFMVDGVSANLGNAGSGAALGQGGAGQLPATSAFGGTSNLVTLDALEEFRIQTSTFAPEYGRMPGAQISVVTKSGTNAFHGTAFEYLRNDKLDANDWFANANGLPRPELRQNDFGGVLGGPIRKDKLFFFGSYEGLRVRQPKVANTYVPSLASRQNAPAAVQPLLDAFPLPNGPDLGDGTAAFSASYSDPSTLNSYSLRIDYLLSSKFIFFGRYNDAPSKLDQRGAGVFQGSYSSISALDYHTQTLTVGGSQALTPRLTNEARFNYSRSRGKSTYKLDNFGGAVPPPDSSLFPSFASAQNDVFNFFGDFNPYGLILVVGNFGNNLVQQFNVTDNISYVTGTHQMKFGLDYRRLMPQAGFPPYNIQYAFLSLANVLTNTVPASYIIATIPVTLIFSNWSLYAQDTWKAARSITVTYGVRWEYNPPLSAEDGRLPFTAIGVDNPATMMIAPQGTPLWKAQKDDFAPRLGVAWQARPNLVLRAGAGIFYDLGYSAVANGAITFPYARVMTISNTSFPLSDAAAAPPPFSTAPPAWYFSAIDPHHVLPRTYEWNAAVERSLATSDVLTITYLGAAGRKLMRQDIYYTPDQNFTGEVDIFRNGARSSYQALQAQFRHRFAHGLQALLSYTWAHAIDDVSSDVNWQNVPPGSSTYSDRGSSDYDIRHTFSGAISYDLPAPGGGLWKTIFGSWSTDSIIHARSAPPVNVVTGNNPFGGYLSDADSVQRPNLVPGMPLWISDPNVAAGKRINIAAFSVPTGPVQGDVGRNALRGFGATQVDFTLRRDFPLTERFHLQARADFFNIFNHPNFGLPVNYMTSPLFGQATQMLGASLGSGGQNGGLNPLYQIGGPRSVQLALKLVF